MLISKGFPAIKGINYCTYYYVPCQEHLALPMVSADCCVWSSVTTRIDSSFSSETPDCEATDATLESINF
jgi:hypothetical protein